MQEGIPINRLEEAWAEGAVDLHRGADDGPSESLRVERRISHEFNGLNGLDQAGLLFAYLNEARDMQWPMRDDDGRPEAAAFIDQRLDGEFRVGIQVACRLVQHEDRGIHQDGAGDGDALALAAG